MKTVTASAADRTLFHAAATALNDPLAWWQIAQASGLTDPWLLVGLTTLTVPASGLDDNGGLAPQ